MEADRAEFLAKNFALSFAWYVYMQMRNTSRYVTSDESIPVSTRVRFRHRTRINQQKMLFIKMLLASVHRGRTREVWMHPHSLAWFDMVDQLYNDELWYANFRVTRETFAFILRNVQQRISRNRTVMREPVQPRRRLALTLYFLASTAEYRTVANLFGVSRSFLCNCVKEVCCAIIQSFPTVINFPKGDDLLNVLGCYEQRWGFPMCAGAIDGTHIPILAPSENHVEYVNRKGFHSIIMQAVTDCNYLFRDIVVGWPGSVHDARVLSNSTIYKNGNGKDLFPNGVMKEICGVNIPPVLIGDPAYPLLPWLLKGYPRNTASQSQQKFNKNLSRARMTVENTFGRWKGRFIRFSKRVDMEVSSLVDVVHASCILHNICELQRNVFLADWEIVSDAFEVELEPIDDINNAPDAENIRNALTEHFT